MVELTSIESTGRRHFGRMSLPDVPRTVLAAGMIASRLQLQNLLSELRTVSEVRADAGGISDLRVSDEF
jgi:hypothetical protein